MPVRSDETAAAVIENASHASRAPPRRDDAACCCPVEEESRGSSNLFLATNKGDSGAGEVSNLDVAFDVAISARKLNGCRYGDATSATVVIARGYIIDQNHRPSVTGPINSRGVYALLSTHARIVPFMFSQ